jgi:hypothetical protein
VAHAPGKEMGTRSHRDGSTSTRWHSGVPATVAGDEVERILQLYEGKEMVRCGGIIEENSRWRCSLIEGDDGEGGSKSIAPGGRFRRRGGQTEPLGRGEAVRGFRWDDWRVKWGGRQRELSTACSLTGACSRRDKGEREVEEGVGVAQRGGDAGHSARRGRQPVWAGGQSQQCYLLCARGERRERGWLKPRR